MDSRDEAFAKLEATREYVFAVSEDVNRALMKGLFKPGAPKERIDWLNQWRSFELEFVGYYNAVQNGGITYLEAGDVIAACASYNNRARSYQEALAKLGIEQVTPLPPIDTPPPTIAQGIAEAGKGLAALAAVVALALLLKK